MEQLAHIVRQIVSKIALTKSVEFIDIIQILLIAVFVYYFISWVKRTQAYTLFKGIIFIGAMILIFYITGMATILWIFKQLSTVVLVALVVVFQPELRKLLEQLGERNTLASMFSFLYREKEVDKRISDRSIDELVRAAYEMGQVKTGALMVLENDVFLSEYEKTGIAIDSIITSQLLINIFEHNTPLHDGAVLIRNDRIQAATCYLPLSDNLNLNKNLGTRHRAAVGISEVSDALTIIVSEETGNVSYTYKGKIRTGVAPAVLREQLKAMQTASLDEDKRKKTKGRDGK